jgi:hypothetical protein
MLNRLIVPILCVYVVAFAGCLHYSGAALASLEHQSLPVSVSCALLAGAVASAVTFLVALGLFLQAVAAFARQRKSKGLAVSFYERLPSSSPLFRAAREVQRFIFLAIGSWVCAVAFLTLFVNQ